MQKQGVKLQKAFLAKGSVAELNRDEFIQIVTNLIRNSTQSILEKKKSGEVLVKAERLGTILCIDITDDGGGISPENQSRIFDQGFTTKPPNQGTGLGLSICRRYARAFGGEVELLFSDPEGKGTCFRLTVPLLEAASHAANS
jgi:signal transduction histidine kinase